MDEARAERIRRREVLRAIGRIKLSPGEERAIERLSRSLVARIVRDPICEARASVGVRRFDGGVPGDDRHER